LKETTIYWHLAANSHLTGGEACLSPAEQQVFAGLRFPKRRAEWLLGRLAAKTLLQRCSPEMASLPGPAIEIGKKAKGAPYYQVRGEFLPVSLSISHRSGLAFCALCFNPALTIGVDLEQVEPRQAGFIEDYFTPLEVEMVYTCPQNQQAFMTALVWSAKEAALKALEEGLRLDTRQVAVSVDGVSGSDSIGWRRLALQTPAQGTHIWNGWWLRRGDKVLTLVIKSELPIVGEVRLEELPAD
jgi:phosphopantetheinyl transferase